MHLYPAIDVMGGSAVRLERGDFARRREYDDDPLDAARRWAREGARHLHVVDLDGAREGRPVNLEHLRRISAELRGHVELIQYGGGLRTEDHVRQALETGAGRVVVGTAALSDDDLLRRLLDSHGGRVAVGVDVREGRVAVRGWQERTGETAAEAIERLVAAGVATIVYTNVDLDGTLSGISPEPVRAAAAAAAGRSLVCSGGIASLADLETLSSLGLDNLEGVIVGKALYEARFTVEEAMAALGPEPATAA